MARKGGELLEQSAAGGEGWLANDRLDWDSDYAAAHNFGDGGHGGHDGCHHFCFWGEAVVAVKNKLNTNTSHGAVHGLRLIFCS